MELRPVVLALLEARPLYGYELVQLARRRGKLRLEEGTVYPLLHAMEREKLLASKWRTTPQGRERKYYQLTRRGRTALTGARSDFRSISKLLLGGAHA